MRWSRCGVVFRSASRACGRDDCRAAHGSARTRPADADDAGERSTRAPELRAAHHDRLLVPAARELGEVRRHQHHRGERLVGAGEGQKRAFPQINLEIFDYELDFAGLKGEPESLATGPVDDLNLFVHNDNVHGFVLDLHGRAGEYSVADLREHMERLEEAVRRLSELGSRAASANCHQ